jgi:hypothetical protein
MQTAALIEGYQGPPATTASGEWQKERAHLLFHAQAGGGRMKWERPGIGNAEGRSWKCLRERNGRSS